MSFREAPFEALIHPIGATDFFERWWQTRSLHVRGEAGKFDGVVNSDELSGIVRKPAAEGPLSLYAGFADRSGTHRQFRIQAHQIDPLLKAGLTLQANFIHAHHPGLGSLVASLRKRFNMTAAGEAGFFESEDGSGYAMHFDAMEMWVLQLEGQKRWSYSPVPAIRFPNRNVIWEQAKAKAREGKLQGIAGPEETGLVETVLSPGDLLYLPGGTWHTTRTLGRSAHVSIAFEYQPPLQFLVETVLQRLIADDPAWRSMPCPPLPPDALREQMESYFAARLGDLRRSLDGVSAAEIYESWRGLLAAHG